MKEYIHLSKIDSIFVPKIKYTFKDDEAFYFVMGLLKSDIYQFTKHYHETAIKPQRREVN